MIVIGLGTGRSGTASLAKLLSSQRDAMCFHEMNPSCVRFSGTPRPILNAIDEFQAIINGGDPSMVTVDLSRKVSAEAYDRLCRMARVRLIGDVAFYYLTYVEAIAARTDNVRFICLRRDKEATVQSWMRKTAIARWRSKRLADRLASLITREPYHETHNFWMEHDGQIWRSDSVWDKCFPKFPGPTKFDAISQYWDYYYEKADMLAAKLTGQFRIIDTDRLSDKASQAELLSFCGIPFADQIFVEAHTHRSA
jgi:Sulfotransferase family